VFLAASDHLAASDTAGRASVSFKTAQQHRFVHSLGRRTLLTNGFNPEKSNGSEGARLDLIKQNSTLRLNAQLVNR